MKDSKKTIIIILIIVCIFISSLAIFLGNKNQQNNNNNNTGNTTDNYKINKTFTRVDNYLEFFSIQNAINDNLDLTKHFNALEIYSNNDSKLNYYFIKGTITEMLMDDETSSFEKANYLLIVNNSNKIYEFITLNSNINDLQIYANSYNVEYKTISGNKKLPTGSENVSVVLSNYIEYFKNLLFFDPKTAYNMLTNTTKAKYNGYDDFYSKLVDIYNSLSSIVYGYNIEKTNDYVIYNINDTNYNKITIMEYNIMDFTIEY